jgi:hypothetical protein
VKYIQTVKLALSIVEEARQSIFPSGSEMASYVNSNLKKHSCMAEFLKERSVYKLCLAPQSCAFPEAGLPATIFVDFDQIVKSSQPSLG